MNSHSHQSVPPIPGAAWIHLRAIRTRAVLGIYPAERTHLRPVQMDISLARDISAAAATDDFSATLNYEEIETEAIDIARRGKFRLIETLAERIAAACLAHPGVLAVRVIVDKPKALPHTDSVAIEVFHRVEKRRPSTPR